MVMLRACAFLVAMLAGNAAALAQEVFAPAATVDMDTISTYDVDQRAALLIAMGAPEEIVQEQALEDLIDDMLKMHFAERFGLSPTDEEVDVGVAEFAALRNLTPEQMNEALAGRGISIETIRGLVRAGLVWRQIVQTQFRAVATPTEFQEDQALSLLASIPDQSLLLAEIVLPFAERGGDETMAFSMALAEQLSAGDDFAAAARELSRSASAVDGGQLDWLPEKRLPPLIAQQALVLDVGDVSPPIPFPQGVVILKLLQKRQEPIAQKEGLNVTFNEIVVAADINTIRARANQVKTCADMRRLVAEAGLRDPIREAVPVSQLDQGTAWRLAQLDPGEADIMQVEGGVSVLFLCERTTATDEDSAAREQQRIFTQRIEALGEGLLQQLRQQAVIDIR